MKYCEKCGQELEENLNFCPSCGAKVGASAPQYSNYSNDFDAPSTGYAVLGFFFPIVGLILYLVWQDKYPLRAKSCGKGALIGFIVNVVLTICYAIMMGIAASQGLY